MIDLTKLPPLVHCLVAAIASTASLLFTQALIDNRTEKLVTGLASIWIPLGYLLIAAVMHAAHARVTAARIAAGQATRPTP